MKIGVIVGSTQRQKVDYICKCLNELDDVEVLNFGCFENEELTYVEVALLIGLLINSKAIDYVITGCSSGQGMMLACNLLPNVICGYAPKPLDAALFHKINDGNVLSLPLGQNYGFEGYDNLRNTIEAFMNDNNYFKISTNDLERKQKDTLVLKQLRCLSQVPMLEYLKKIDPSFLNKVLTKRDVVEYIFTNGSNEELVTYLASTIASM